MSNSNSSKQVLLSVIGIAIVIVTIVGVAFAFFNYTRTGTSNTIRVGRISFLTTQSNTLSLTNVFPLASGELANANLDEVELRIQGDTTYTGGEEFQITIEGVNNTIGTSPNEKTIPINFIARYVQTATGDNIGSAAVSDYFSERGSTTTVYKLTETGVAENGTQVLVGYIPRNGEIDGTLKISAYLDASNITISDTYYENAPTPTPTGPNDEYGTTTEWVNGRTVLTTTEWNDLQNSQEPLSFKIKAVSQEGTWVEKPVWNLKNLIISRVGYDGLVAVNTDGDLASSGDAIRDYRYSGGGRYCTYLSPDGNTNYNLQVEENTCPTGALFNSWDNSFVSIYSDYLLRYNMQYTNDDLYTLISDGVQETDLKNYVWFNNELWRIVGIIDGYLKIVKDLPITQESMPLNYTNADNDTFTLKNTMVPTTLKYATVTWNDGGTKSGINDWSESGLMYWLNEDNGYYGTISNSYKNLILETTYKLGNVNYASTAKNEYIQERATPIICNNNVTNDSHNNNCNIWSGNPTTWTGKIALLYPSDFGYASDSSNWALNTDKYKKDPERNVLSDNWILHTAAIINWSISPSSLKNDKAVEWDEFGNSFNSSGYDDVSTYGADSVRPVINLKDDTLTIGGDGSYSNPYILKTN